MDMDTATLIVDGDERRVPARRRGDTLLFALGDVAAATGWTLEPAGLCRGGVCVPTRTRPDLVVDGAVDLFVLADLVHRPLAIEAAHGVAVLADAPAERAAAMAALAAPDFSLPDVDGRPVAFSSLGRRKKLLLAWASW
jgi:hypothetical protein